MVMGAIEPLEVVLDVMGVLLLLLFCEEQAEVVKD